MTNAEKIRTMTDEGLAEFLSVSFMELLNAVAEDGELSRHGKPKKDTCDLCIRAWLKSEEI